MGAVTTPWLDERERRAWRGFHALRAGLTARLGRELHRTTGLTEAEYAILAVVSESDGQRLRARELATRLGWERSRLSHQIRRMQQRGTIDREACPADARGFNVVLTPLGRTVIEAAAPHHLETVRHCFVDLLSPEELDLLGDIAERVDRHLREDHTAHDCGLDPL